MQRQTLLLIVVILSLVLDRAVDGCKQFYQKTDKRIWFVEESIGMRKRSRSLVQCLLTCSRRKYECDMAGYSPVTGACILYEESTQMMIVDEDDGIDLYVPRKNQQEYAESHPITNVEQPATPKTATTTTSTSTSTTPTTTSTTISTTPTTTTTTTPTPTTTIAWPLICTDPYKTGPTCQDNKDLKQGLDERCKEADINRPIAIFQAIGGNFLWRCHSVNTLSADHLFYVSGSDYDESMHNKLKTWIDNHPYYKGAQFEMSRASKSCDNKCTEIQKTCKPTETANSIYPFHLTGKSCHHHEIDKSSGGTSFWRSGKDPITSSTGQCQGFINIQTFSCSSPSGSHEQRVCRCV